MRGKLSLTALFVGLAMGICQSKADRPVVSVQTGWLWYGLTPGGNLVSIYCHPSKGQYLKCHWRVAEAADLERIGGLLSESGVIGSRASYDFPEEKLAGMSKEEQTEQAAQASLLRISAWGAGDFGEASVAGLENSPPNVKILAEKLRRVCEEAPPSSPSGAVISINADRVVGPENQTYADLLDKAGRKFTEWDPAFLIPEVAGVCSHPETMEILDAEALAWLRGKLPKGEDAILVKVGGRSLQLIAIGAPTEKRTPEYAGPPTGNDAGD